MSTIEACAEQFYRAMRALPAQAFRLVAGTRQTRMLGDRTAEAFARVIVTYDGETIDHCRRTTAKAMALATFLGYQGTALDHLRWGALLHDLGKIAVPRRILHKPGPLTEEEWAIVRRHPEVAATILEPIPYLRSSLAIPHFHHERWDGTGYPLGLKGFHIPMAARIFALIDVYDAVTSARPYRTTPMTDQEACDLIRAGAGTHFDPDIVSCFLLHHATRSSSSRGR